MLAHESYSKRCKEILHDFNTARGKYQETCCFSEVVEILTPILMEQMNVEQSAPGEEQL